MKSVRIDPDSPDPELLAEAGEIIRRGGLVAFPTETVYGLGASALDPEAVARIFRAKERPSYNPLIAHVAAVEEAQALTTSWPRSAELLAAAFWPGPLTLVLPKRGIVPDIATAGLPSVALRMPDHPIALGVIRSAGVPVAAPSANRFTELSPTAAAHVIRGLGDRVDLVLDGGPTRVGIESTVIDLTGERPALLRPGTLSRAAIEEVVGPVLQGGTATGESPRPAPGMIERHYSPRAELRVIAGEEAVAPAIRAAVSSGRRVGAIVIGSGAPAGEHVRRLPASPTAYARELYSTLHGLDEAGCDLVLVEAVPADEAWDGVRDRLRRASHGS